MASIVRDSQVLPGLRPRNDRAVWKRIAAVLESLRFSKSGDLKLPGAAEASDKELQKLAHRVKTGPIDRKDRQDLLVVLYGGGVMK
jgi:hypothetical protein